MRNSIGYTANTRGLQVTFKKNRMFMENLKNGVKAVNKQMLGAFAAQGLHNMVMSTHHDSSRAAANWNLSFGATMPQQTWDPAEYKGSVNGVGAIGDRGEKRGETGQDKLISEYKGMYYGYHEWNGKMLPTPGGKIWNALGIGKSGNPPKVIIYNPIMNPSMGRYPEHAFDMGVDLKGKGSKTMPLDDLRTGLLPKLLRDTLLQIKFGATFK